MFSSCLEIWLGSRIWAIERPKMLWYEPTVLLQWVRSWGGSNSHCNFVDHYYNIWTQGDPKNIFTLNKIIISRIHISGRTQGISRLPSQKSMTCKVIQLITKPPFPNNTLIKTFYLVGYLVRNNWNVLSIAYVYLKFFCQRESGIRVTERIGATRL